MTRNVATAEGRGYIPDAAPRLLSSHPGFLEIQSRSLQRAETICLRYEAAGTEFRPPRELAHFCPLGSGDQIL